MKFIPVRDLRIRPGRVFRSLREGGELVVTSHGKPIAILAEASEDTFEEVLSALRSMRTLAAVRKIRKEASDRKCHPLSDSDIEAEVQAARNSRKSSQRRRSAGS